MIDQLEDGVAYRIDATGRAEEFDWRAAPTPRDDRQFEWIHLSLDSPDARTWLSERSGLDALVVETLMENETRPRCVPMAGGLVVMLRGVNLNPGADPEDMVALRIWAEEGRVITTRRRPLMAIRDMRALVESGNGPRTVGDFLVEVAVRLVERMAGVLATLDDSVDTIEESVAESHANVQRSELSDVRREAIALRRYLAPQRDALARLANERVSWLTEAQRLRLREETDTTIRYVEDLDAARERTALVQEELNNRLSEQLNRRMFALSIIAGIFLPLSFITGLLGINVAGIPGAEAGTAFAIVCGALLVLGAGELLLFRRLGWL